MTRSGIPGVALQGILGLRGLLQQEEQRTKRQEKKRGQGHQCQATACSRVNLTKIRHSFVTSGPEQPSSRDKGSRDPDAQKI